MSEDILSCQSVSRPVLDGCTHGKAKKCETASQSWSDQAEGWIWFYGKRLKFGELRYFALGCFVRIVFVREWDEADAFSAQNIF